MENAMIGALISFGGFILFASGFLYEKVKGGTTGLTLFLCLATGVGIMFLIMGLRFNEIVETQSMTKSAIAFLGMPALGLTLGYTMYHLNKDRIWPNSRGESRNE